MHSAIKKSTASSDMNLHITVNIAEIYACEMKWQVTGTSKNSGLDAATEPPNQTA